VAKRKSKDNLRRLLDQIEAEAGDGHVSVRDVLGILGPRAFTPMLLVPSLVLVSPASAIPAVPSFLSLLVGLVAMQMLLGHDRIWLPRILLDRALDPTRFARIMRALRHPVALVDPLINERLTWLADKPGNIPALVICAIISFFMPLVEFVPFLTSLLAGAIALFATGMFARDGLLMLLGYGLVGGGAALVTGALKVVTG